MRTILFIGNTVLVNKAPIAEQKRRFRAYKSAGKSHHTRTTQAEAEEIETNETYERETSHKIQVGQLVLERHAVDRS
jgi:hypothetical protein